MHRPNPSGGTPSDELLDAHFDRELPTDRAGELFRALNDDPRVSALFTETQNALDALRTPVDAPDLSGAILNEVGRRRGWLDAGWRRFVTVGRVAMAACLLMGLAATLAAQRMAPDAAIFPPQSTPIADVARCASSDAQGGVDEFRSAMSMLGNAAGLDKIRSLEPPKQCPALRESQTPRQGSDPMLLNASTRSGSRHSGDFDLSLVNSGDDSLKRLTMHRRVGGLHIIISKPASDAEDAKETTVGGW